ncbi:acetyl-CoA hydrolase/transferase C-terminal domain-containing protein [Microvirga antarctica]|uniref:acetyl-CoA hydrolase/transferase C-terminal domain-containing protein n=1 Tax=Microvirga antarctica TaxID=2819233 RepID=UPI001FEA1413|nr:acetyl-CoA hydrolase/transferase C-terminal domain-containing protein [Microvirga antarctica]
MMSSGSVRSADPDAIADRIIQSVGPRIVLALPLGIGKANRVANALYHRAARDPSISLEVFTALSLNKPRASSTIEQRFLGPMVERVFGAYPDLAYVSAIAKRDLPPNIVVNEFFFQAGQWLHSPVAQQAYISANYTHVVPLILQRGVNVIAQLVAPSADGASFSLSSNTDLTLDLLQARRDGKADFLFVVETNAELPYMTGEAEIAGDAVSYILDSDGVDFPLFAPPNRPISDAEHALGLRVASLIPDGGTLQIGIGSVGDAVAQGLILREAHNQAFTAALDSLENCHAKRHTAPFERGLYGASEMFAPGFLALAEAGILRRTVDGIVLEAGFFVGPRDFYRRLREMPVSQREQFRMTAISAINELYGDEAAKRKARVQARFVNNAMMVTALGAVVSDSLDDGRVVSGVGGQYNFVAQAFALDGARSVITLPATRRSAGAVHSNVLWNYASITIPRHLRDMVVTEYGVADLRGRTDRDVIVAMLSVTDARFQDGLLKAAKAARKIEGGYKIPPAFRRNTPERIGRVIDRLRQEGILEDYPFGTDFTPVEQRLLPALECLKTSSPLQLAGLLMRGLRGGGSAAEILCLERMGFAEPHTIRDRVFASLVRGALRSRGSPR